MHHSTNQQNPEFLTTSSGFNGRLACERVLGISTASHVQVINIMIANKNNSIAKICRISILFDVTDFRYLEISVCARSTFSIVSATSSSIRCNVSPCS